MESLRKNVEEHTNGVLKAHAITLKHKGKNLNIMSARLKDSGISADSEIVLTLNPAAQVPAAPTMVQAHEGFPGEPVTRPKKERKEGQIDKKRERFSKEEAENLIKGVGLYGLGQWAQIRLSYFEHSQRSGVDLKDKWRNLVTASQRPMGFKFRVEYLNDPAFLEKVAQTNITAMKRGIAA